MAKNNLTTGRRAGTMHVRVLPNTKHFPRELKQQLERIEKSIPALKVDIKSANVDRNRLQRSIKAQLARIGEFEIDVTANVKEIRKQLQEVVKEKPISIAPELDRIMVQRLQADIAKAMREIEPKLSLDVDDDEIRNYVEYLSREFERLNTKIDLQILTPEEAAEIRHRLHEIKDEIDEVARDRTVRVDVNPFTSWASARLAWLARPRVVELIPKVAKAAALKAATMLAALSGARLSYDYMKRFSDWISDLDKKLPSIAFSAIGLTTAFAGIMGSISGIVGIGDGFAATLPSLLLVPGLLAGAAMSAVALFVALKDSKDELAELGDGYKNLGQIIKHAFWTEARQSIIDFSNSIMPQLERSFEKTSIAIGKFTAKLAKSFQDEFAGGRLEKMFDGLTESWNELSKGTDAFAGAITNLGLVAARYMPRLAKWFVRQADTFDNWLSQVATDGRLDGWIEESIDAFYALWDVMAATTGIFQGLWKAAEAGGSGGLRGFADMLLRWEKAVNGAKWQETLTAMFRGANKALDGFAYGLERLGNMLHTQRVSIEYFVGTAGTALGNFIAEVSDALARPKFGDGLVKFIDGVSRGLEGLEPALAPLSDMFGSLLGFMGTFAEELGKTLGLLGEKVAPEIEKILDRIEPRLGELGETLRGVIEEIDWESIGNQAADLLDGVIVLANELVPLLGEVVELVDELGVLKGVANLAEDLGNVASALGDVIDLLKGDELKDGAFSDGSGLVESLGDISMSMGGMGFMVEWLYEQFMKIEGMPELIDAAWAAFPDIWNGFKDDVVLAFTDFPALVREKGAETAAGWLVGAQTKWLDVTVWLATRGAEVMSHFATSGAWLITHGTSLMTGFRAGVLAGWAKVTGWFTTVSVIVKGFFSGAGSWLYDSGVSLLAGFKAGIIASFDSVKREVESGLAGIRALFPFSPAKEGPFSGRGWVSYSGESVGATFGDSAVDALKGARDKISRSLGGIRSDFTSLSGDVSSMRPSFDIASQFTTARDYSVNLSGAVSSSVAALGGPGGSTGLRSGDHLVLRVGSKDFDAYVDGRAGAVSDIKFEAGSEGRVYDQFGVK